jgi:RNA polymerase sigma-70 factor (ECF subfamily)
VTDRSRGEDPGDRIGRLYDQHAAGLYRYALMVLADPGAAADVVQQVFVGLLRVGSDVDSDERYLRRAVRNECYSSLRRRRRDPATVDAPILEAVPGVADDPDERLALERAMRALPPEQREVVHLKVYEGLTFQEIADVAGESINTIASRYRYAIEKLREQLK